jgi:toxin ParE1/3/4
MARLRISASAQADIQNLLLTSLERWGPAGRARYAVLLTTALRTIAAEPDGATTRDRGDLLAGIRSVHIRHARGSRGVREPVHVVYYRAIRPELIEIVRVLHQRMDPSRHLDESSAAEPGSRLRATRSARRR